MQSVEEVRIDTSRAKRTGIAEAVYAQGKTESQLLDALAALTKTEGGAVLATRCSPEQLASIAEAYPEAFIDEVGRIAMLRRDPRPASGTVAIVTGGTTDLPVAREAAVSLDALGGKADLLIDRGVAGVHRTLEAADHISDADVVIAVAGFEGALASVIAGLVLAPVIAVPTSTGYGSSFEGMTAQLSMLASCAPGVAVVGIDNGFGAAVHAAKILRNRDR